MTCHLERKKTDQCRKASMLSPSHRVRSCWYDMTKLLFGNKQGKKNVLCYEVKQISLEAHWPQRCTAEPWYCCYYPSTTLWNPLQQHPLLYHLQLLPFAFWTILIQATTRAARLELHKTLQSSLNISWEGTLFSLNFLDILVNIFQKYLNALRGCCLENVRLSACWTPTEATICC